MQCRQALPCQDEEKTMDGERAIRGIGCGRKRLKRIHCNIISKRRTIHISNPLLQTILHSELLFHLGREFGVHMSRSPIRSNGTAKKQDIGLGPTNQQKEGWITCTRSSAPIHDSYGFPILATPVQTAAFPSESSSHTLSG